MINVILLLNIIYVVYSIKCPNHLINNQNCMMNNDAYHKYVEGIYIHILREGKKINEIETLINCYNNGFKIFANNGFNNGLNNIRRETKESVACNSLLQCFRDLQAGCKSEQYYYENKDCSYTHLINELYIPNDCEIIFYDLIIVQNKIKKNLEKFKNQYNITNTTEIKLLLIKLKTNQKN